MMKKGVILVDFDNAFYGQCSNADVIFCQIGMYLSFCLSSYSDLESVDIRLYGGWRAEARNTKLADELNGYLEDVNSRLFPYVYKGKKVRGNVSLVISQFNLDIEWKNTYQEKCGRHYLKVKADSSRVCNNDPSICPIHMIANATRGVAVSCPNKGCENIDINQLVRMEQKMVDSMMTCDILEYTQDKDYRVVEVVSDDVDLHPALALAGERYSAKNNVNLLLLLRNRVNMTAYSELLSPYHVDLRLWQ